MVFMIGVSNPTIAVCMLGRLRTRPSVRLTKSIHNTNSAPSI